MTQHFQKFWDGIKRYMEQLHDVRWSAVIVCNDSLKIYCFCNTFSEVWGWDMKIENVHDARWSAVIVCNDFQDLASLCSLLLLRPKYWGERGFQAWSSSRRRWENVIIKDKRQRQRKIQIQIERQTQRQPKSFKHGAAPGDGETISIYQYAPKNRDFVKLRVIPNF